MANSYSESSTCGLVEMRGKSPLVEIWIVHRAQPSTELFVSVFPLSLRARLGMPGKRKWAATTNCFCWQKNKEVEWFPLGIDLTITFSCEHPLEWELA